jgi:hypothetical protein
MFRKYCSCQYDLFIHNKKECQFFSLWFLLLQRPGHQDLLPFHKQRSQIDCCLVVISSSWLKLVIETGILVNKIEVDGQTIRWSTDHQPWKFGDRRSNRLYILSQGIDETICTKLDQFQWKLVGRIFDCNYWSWRLVKDLLGMSCLDEFFF